MRKENNGNIKKEFTKKEISNIIEKDYNPLKVNYRLIYRRRDGLYEMKNKILKEFKRELDFKGRIIISIFPKTFIKVYKKGIEKGFNSRT